MIWEDSTRSEIQEIDITPWSKDGHRIWLLREDELHPVISGNKMRKLKYHVQKARNAGVSRIVTYGGAFSNHIVAAACAANESGLESVGLIRGEELTVDNPTLRQAQRYGMKFYFVPRDKYRSEKEALLVEYDLLDDSHVIPEGGADQLGVKGCEEILSDDTLKFNVIACSAGTGTTAAGLSKSLDSHQSLRVYPALKGSFMLDEIKKLTSLNESKVSVIEDYSFGGYANTSEELFSFIRDFYRYTGVKLDPIYTGKMMFGLLKEIGLKRVSPDCGILAIHTGGLQGIRGIELRDNVTLFDDWS